MQAAFMGAALVRMAWSPCGRGGLALFFAVSWWRGGFDFSEVATCLQTKLALLII